MYIHIYIQLILHLLGWYVVELGMAEQREPLTLLCTHREEGSVGRERVTDTECLHQ